MTCQHLFQKSYIFFFTSNMTSVYNLIMALKKDGDKTQILLVVKKTSAEKLREIADKENRPVGRMFDVIIEDHRFNDTTVNSFSINFSN